MLVKIRARMVLFLRELFALLPFKVLISVALPYALAIALIVSVGGQLQYAVSRLLSSDAPTLYAAVFENAINRKIPIGMWIGFAFSFPWLAIGAVTAIIAIPERRLDRVILTTCWVLPLCLTAVDVVQGLINHVPLSNHLENLIANFVGGPIAALFASPSLLIIYSFQKLTFKPEILKVLLSAFLSISWGAVICLGAFLGYNFFFIPVSQELEIVFNLPIKGMSFAPASFEQKKPNNNFSFLPKNDISGNASIIAPHGKISAAWKSLHGGIYKASIYLMSDCASQNISQIPLAKPLFIREKIKSVSLRTDKGHSELKISGGKIKYNYSPQMPASYWVDHEKGDKIKVAHFVSDEDTIDANVTVDAGILISISGMNYKNGSVFPVARSISVKTDNDVFIFKFPEPRIDNSTHQLECREITPIQNGQTGAFHVPGSSMHGALLLKFERISNRNVYFSHDANVEIEHASGWFGVENIPVDQLGEDKLGTTGYLSSQGVAELFRLNGADAQINKSDILLSVGSLKPSFTSGGAVRITGAANQIWRGQQRLSPTKWERLPFEVKITLLTFLLSLGGCAEVTRRFISRNAKNYIFSI